MLTCVHKSSVALKQLANINDIGSQIMILRRDFYITYNTQGIFLFSLLDILNTNKNIKNT